MKRLFPLVNLFFLLSTIDVSRLSDVMTNNDEPSSASSSHIHSYDYSIDKSRSKRDDTPAQADDAYHNDDDDDVYDDRHERHGGASHNEQFDPHLYLQEHRADAAAAGDDDDEHETLEDYLENNNATFANCSSCAIRETRRLVRIEMIKKDVLKKLKLETTPRFNSSMPNTSVLPSWIFNNSDQDEGHRGDDGESEGFFQTIIFGERRKYILMTYKTQL